MAKDPSIYATLESLGGWGGPSSPYASSDDSLYQTCVFADAADDDGDGGTKIGATPAPPPPRPRPPLTRSLSLKCGGGGRFGDPGSLFGGGGGERGEKRVRNAAPPRPGGVGTAASVGGC